MSRKRLFEVVELSGDNDRISNVYDVFMMTTIFISIVPLAFKEQNIVFTLIDNITVIIFIADYLARFATADFKIRKKGITPFVLYLFSPMAIIDLLSILPSITLLNSGLRLLKIFRLIRTFRVFRIFKAVRYSKSISMFINVFKKQKESLLTICWITVAYIVISALVILNVEPESFNNFFDAIYWATISLTTVGYGDIYPVTVAGKIVTMISSITGIAIVAMPAGIITAGLMDEIKNK